jgi:hypothetical protein
MTRRELLLSLGGALTAPRVLLAQQKAMPVIGLLFRSPCSNGIPRTRVPSGPPTPVRTRR